METTTYTIWFDSTHTRHRVGYARSNGSHGSCLDVAGNSVQEVVNNLGKDRIWVRDVATRETLYASVAGIDKKWDAAQ